ncbi:MAG: hypothetical protein IMZ71_02645, partial [Chloroflexi bacterium]|nr:hypothetical protein [Chloroflexota bacterium]
MNWTHYFDEDMAVEYGVECAIVIAHLQGWIRKSKASGRHQHDGKWWTYNSTKAWAELLPFWSAGQIGRILNKLIEAEVLVTGNYNQTPYDRTLWYAFKDEIWIERKQKDHLSKSTNGKPETDESLT